MVSPEPALFAQSALVTPQMAGDNYNMLARMLIIATVAALLWNGHASLFSDVDSDRFPALTYQNADSSFSDSGQFSLLCSVEDDVDDLRSTLLNSSSVGTRIDAAGYIESIDFSRTFLCTQTLESKHVLLRV